MQMNWAKGLFEPNAEARESVKTLGQLADVFADRNALRAMDANTVVYRVQVWHPVPEGTEGGLFWGVTVIEAGLVGSEYFMTHGHFHLKRDRSEYYATLEGDGALIMMDERRKTWMEPMTFGSVHFIPPQTAHRVANIGKSPLRFMACWPSDAGHDYEIIRNQGFGSRLLCINDRATLVRIDA
jgi:glucose-6-phosphate isomerase